MNRKATSVYTTADEPALPQVEVRTIRLKIEGLTPTYDHVSDTQLFELAGVTVAEVDYPAIAEQLLKQGVPRDIAEPAIERFAEDVWASMLGRELAKRARFA